jgi:hypothetical protein
MPPGLVHDLTLDAVGRHVALVPQRWINPYPKALAELFDGHAVWEATAFMVSFSGCNFFYSTSACNKFVHAAFSVAEGASNLDGPS